MADDDLASSRVDPYDYFFSRQGKRTYHGDSTRPRTNTSQIVFGTDTNSIREAAEAHQRVYRVPLQPQSTNVPLKDRAPENLEPIHRGRPRGPGTSYSAVVEQQGFPYEANVRRRQNELAYQHDADVLHVHKKLGDPAKRQDTRSLDLFAYQVPPTGLTRLTQAPEAIPPNPARDHSPTAPPRYLAWQRHGETNESVSEDSRRLAYEADHHFHDSYRGHSPTGKRRRLPWERQTVDDDDDSDASQSERLSSSDPWNRGRPRRYGDQRASQRKRQEDDPFDVCDRLRHWCREPSCKGATRDPWGGF